MQSWVAAVLSAECRVRNFPGDSSGAVVSRGTELCSHRNEETTCLAAAWMEQQDLMSSQKHKDKVQMHLY